MPQTLLRQLQGQLPSTDIVLMYGLTEAFRSTYLPPEELKSRPNLIGKPIPNAEILVIDDSGKRCGPGEIGELVHHGPTVSMGYWGHPDLTTKVLRPHPDSLPGHPNDALVCYSGDLVRQDDDGFLLNSITDNMWSDFLSRGEKDLQIRLIDGGRAYLNLTHLSQTRKLAAQLNATRFDSDVFSLVWESNHQTSVPVVLTHPSTGQGCRLQVFLCTSSCTRTSTCAIFSPVST